MELKIIKWSILSSNRFKRKSVQKRPTNVSKVFEVLQSLLDTNQTHLKFSVDLNSNVVSSYPAHNVESK